MGKISDRKPFKIELDWLVTDVYAKRLNMRQMLKLQNSLQTLKGKTVSEEAVTMLGSFLADNLVDSGGKQFFSSADELLDELSASDLMELAGCLLSESSGGGVEEAEKN